MFYKIFTIFKPRHVTHKGTVPENQGQYNATKTKATILKMHDPKKSHTLNS